MGKLENVRLAHQIDKVVEGRADKNGNVRIEEIVDIPFRVTITDIIIKTIDVNNNCKSRSHNTIILIDEEKIFDANIKDCEEYDHGPNPIIISRGNKKLVLTSDNFDSNEEISVQIHAGLKFPMFPSFAEGFTNINLFERSWQSLKPDLLNFIKEKLKEQIEDQGQYIGRSYRWNKKNKWASPLNNAKKKNGHWYDDYARLTPLYDTLKIEFDPTLGKVRGSLKIDGYAQAHHQWWTCDLRTSEAKVYVNFDVNIEINADFSSGRARVTLRINHTIRGAHGPDGFRDLARAFVPIALSFLEITKKSELESMIEEAINRQIPSFTDQPADEDKKSLMDVLGIEELIENEDTYMMFLSNIHSSNIKNPVDPNMAQVFNLETEINQQLIADLLNGQQIPEIPVPVEVKNPMTGGKLLEKIKIKLSPEIKPGQVRILLSPHIVVRLNSATVSFSLSAKTDILENPQIEAKCLMALSLEYRYGNDRINIEEISVSGFQSPQFCPNYPEETGFCTLIENVLNDKLYDGIKDNEIWTEIAKDLNDKIGSVLEGGSFRYLSHDDFVERCRSPQWDKI